MSEACYRFKSFEEQFMIVHRWLRTIVRCRFIETSSKGCLSIQYGPMRTVLTVSAGSLIS